MTMQFGKALPKARMAKNCSLSWLWKILLAQPTCFDRSTIEPMGLTVGYRWRFRRCLRMIRRVPLVEAKQLFARADRPNLLIKIPGTREGLPAIEEAIFAGIPVNVTLLFSREHYMAAAEAYMRGVERRIKAGRNPKVGSVASLFVSRWDTAVAGKIPTQLANQLGIAIARRSYKAYFELLGSPRWQRAFNEGALPQRLLWASTGTKDPKASDTLYIESLASPLTVNTMPEATLKAFADHGEAGATIPASGGDSEVVLNEFANAGVDVDALATRLQDQGADSFAKSWNDLLKVISSKSAALRTAA